ncbi:MAG: zinc-binding dehydrogenase, partial [Acidimicrobiia bacterium]
AVNALCASTSYRMLVGANAARMKQGDVVFIWGATGGIGAYATQLVLNGGRDVDIVFEHPGRQTMGASVFAAKRGGMIITCAATSGFMIEYDNRYLWMNLKTLKGCHFANYREAWEANRAIGEGKVHPTMSKVFTLDETGEAANQVHHNQHEGKLGILCLAPEAGLGVTNGEMRERLLPEITLFQRHA